MAITLTWEDAPTVAAIAGRLIESIHKHLTDARMIYCFRSVATTNAGKTTLATATRVTGRLEFLLQADFIIEVAQDTWYTLSESQQVALIDHELTHCAYDPFTGWFLRPHDVEEFYEVIQRRGHWQDGYDGWTDALEQFINDEIAGNH